MKWERQRDRDRGVNEQDGGTGLLPDEDVTKRGILLSEGAFTIQILQCTLQKDSPFH